MYECPENSVSIVYHFGLKDNSMYITINNLNIYNVNTIKLLGIHIDSNLNFHTHTNVLCEKLNKSKIHFSLMRDKLDHNSKKILYYSYFYANLTYGCSIWGHLIKSSSMKRLFIIQKKFVRLWCNAKPNSHTDPLFKKINLLKVHDIVTLETVKIGYRILKNTLNEDLSILFIKNNARENSRNSCRFIIPKHKKDITNKSILCELPRQWNKLPLDIINKPSKQSFSYAVKNRLKSFY